MSERGGPGKLRSHWEERIHVVVSRKGEDSPVYEVKPEHGPGRSRILHRNMLMSCNALPLEEPIPASARKESHVQQRACHKQLGTGEILEDSESSDEEDNYWANRLRHLQHRQTQKKPETTIITPETGAQIPLNPGAEDFRMESPVQEPVGEEGDFGMESSVQELIEEEIAETETVQTETVQLTERVEQDAENGNREPAQPETQRRSQKERRPKETLTYDTLGQPTHRVVELYNSPVYVDTPASGPHGISWAVPYWWGPQMIHPIPVPVGYY